MSLGTPVRERTAARLRWWREMAYIAVFYAVYSLVRNLFGSAAVSPQTAQDNALGVIRVERLLGLYFEESLQDLFLPHEWFIRLWNIFYGSAHFVVTVGALVWLYWAAPARYPVWRNTLLAMTGLAVIGFASFPLMPPRLLPPSFGFVDTLREIGGLWSFESGPIQRVSNQYAAMPSLHFGWSAWSALVLRPLVRRIWARVLATAYPLMTLFAIIVTANHFWLDAVGGVVVLAVGHLLGSALAGRQR